MKSHERLKLLQKNESIKNEEVLRFLRYFCAVLSFAIFASLLGIYIPTFGIHKLHQQVVVILAIGATVIIQGLLVHSFCKKNFNFIKHILVLLILTLQCGLCLAPDPKYFRNYQALYGTMVSVVVLDLMIITQFLCWIITSERLLTVLVISGNIVLAFLSIILNYRIGNEDWIEILWYVAILSGSGSLLFIKVLFNRKIITQSIANSIKAFEFEHYRDMFDSLQEGVIVFEKPSEDQPMLQVFFINELMDRVLAILQNFQE